MSASDKSSRRDVLIGGAAGVGVVTAAGLLAGCAEDDPLQGWGPEDTSGDGGGGGSESTSAQAVVAARVESVPIDDPHSSTWESAEEFAIAMAGQEIAPPVRREPFAPSVSLRAVHDGESIGFLLSWTDEVIDDLTIPTDGFRDACAVLLADGPTDPQVRIMGTGEQPATILHWKADWQRDVDKGFQGLAVSFPNATFDYYPPLGPAGPEAPMPEDYSARDAEQWLPGMAVGNPISQPTKASSVEKVRATGFGTVTSLATQDAMGRGVFSETGWSVVVAKPLSSSDDGEVSLSPGGDYSLAIALWTGRGNDAGGHKSPAAQLAALHLEA